MKLVSRHEAHQMWLKKVDSYSARNRHGGEVGSGLGVKSGYKFTKTG